jgi:hypothetical protein
LTLHFILLKPVFGNHLSYVTILQSSIGRSHKTDLTVCINQEKKMPEQ